MTLSPQQKQALKAMRGGKHISTAIMHIRTVQILKEKGLIVQPVKDGPYELTELGETIEL